MDEYISFVSTNQELDITVLTLAILAGISLVVLIYNLMKSGSSIANKLKTPFNLTLIAIFLLTSTIGLYTWSTTSKVDQVILTNSSIITPFGTCKFDNIKEASFIQHVQNSDSITFLLIEEYNGTVHPLSENNYDVHAILRELKAHLAEQLE